MPRPPRKTSMISSTTTCLSRTCIWLPMARAWVFAQMPRIASFIRWTRSTLSLKRWSTTAPLASRLTPTSVSMPLAGRHTVLTTLSATLMARATELLAKKRATPSMTWVAIRRTEKPTIPQIRCMKKLTTKQTKGVCLTSCMTPRQITRLSAVSRCTLSAAWPMTVSMVWRRDLRARSFTRLRLERQPTMQHRQLMSLRMA
mmetsp:Transcript_21174/g.55149  ORF Transcript_21174/g.55149 Transcript_21174/m.55149 type:complete len:201 (+) Transcript_21174:5991-6593(+)